MKRVALAALSMLPLPVLAQSTTFAPGPSIGVGDQHWDATTADLDGDGDPDVLSCVPITPGQATSSIAFYENLGGGNYGPRIGLTNHPTAVVTICGADLDGDGDPDVLFGATSGPIRAGWIENLGGNSFGPPQSLHASTANISIVRIVPADLDGDGDLDVLWAGSDAVAWHENLGGGVFGPHQQISNAVLGPTSVHATDLDGDGDLDVLSTSNGDNKVAFYLNNGTGSFAAQSVITLASINPHFVTTADLDGDGDVDVLVAAMQGNRVAWFANLGSGSFSPPNVLSSSGNIGTHVTIADLDNDGDQDIVWTMFSATGAVVWFENLGAGTFSSPHVIVAYPSPWATRISLVADDDDDGDPDVLTTGYFFGSIEVYDNQLIPPPVISTATAYGAGCGTPPMTLAPTSTAILGTTMSSTISNTPTSLCVVAMGLSDTVAAPLTLPFDLSGVGMTGCTLYQSAEVFAFGTSPGAQPSTADWSHPTPGSVAALGMRIYTQAFGYAPGANPMQVIASNGIDWRIGNQ